MVTTIFAQLGCLLSPVLEDYGKTHAQLLKLQEENKELATSLLEAQEHSSQADQLLKKAQSALAAADKECTGRKEKNASAQTQLLQLKDERSQAKENFVTSEEGKEVLSNHWLSKRNEYLVSEDFQKLLASLLHRSLSVGFKGCLAQVE